MPDSIIGKVSVGDGATFTPSVNSAGELSWTNNKNLPNPETVDLAQAVIDSGAGIFLPLTGGTVTGSVEVTGGVTADVTGDLIGNVTGNVTGDLTGDVTGDVTGNVTGNVTGDLTGDVTGDVTGNVTGNVTGVASGNLPLAGGTMSGRIIFDDTVSVVVKKTTDDDFVEIQCATDYTEGAYLSLYGKDYDADGGRFVIAAADGNTINRLMGSANGNLSWAGENILRNSYGSIGVRRISCFNNGVKGTFTVKSSGTSFGISAIVSFVSSTNQANNRIYFVHGYWQGGERTYYWLVPIWSNNGNFTPAVLPEGTNGVSFTMGSAANVECHVTVLGESDSNQVQLTFTPT